jgi:hypothetical protein
MGARFPKLDRTVLFGLFGLLLFASVYMHQRKFDAPTPVSRLYLLHALMNGTFSIDAYHRPTPDKAIFEGRYYSDKAPGTSALAFPAFAATALALGLAGTSLDEPKAWLITSWAASAFANGLLVALGGVALFAWLSRRVAQRWALLTTLGIFLGAAPLIYATMMFSHAMVVGLLAITIWAIGRGSESESEGEGERDGKGEGGRILRKDSRLEPLNPNPTPTPNLNPTPTPTPNPQEIKITITSRIRTKIRRLMGNGTKWDALAGFACGWAVASEFTAGIVAVALFLWLISLNWRRGVPFMVGTIPPLLLIPAYSWACFGNPFVLPYSLQASFPAMQEGLYAIKWPDADTAVNLLIHPGRGLFFWTPFLVMAGFGYARLFRESSRLYWLMYAIPLLQILVISGRVWDWQAGPTLGPRYLAPILPLLALPCAYGLRKVPWLGLPLLVYSILITTLATLTDACPSYGGHPNPLFDLHLPMLRKGEFSPNIGLALGLPPYYSVGLYYTVLLGGTVWLWRSCAGKGKTNEP